MRTFCFVLLLTGSVLGAFSETFVGVLIGICLLVILINCKPLHKSAYKRLNKFADSFEENILHFGERKPYRELSEEEKAEEESTRYYFKEEEKEKRA